MPLIDALSPARFATYLGWAGQDPDLAMRLYTYNTQVTAALYSPLHMLEVSLRNVTDRALTQAKGATWLDGQGLRLTPYQVDCINKARQTLGRQRKAITRDPIIAELNFGFWTSLFGHESHALWTDLRPIFQTGGLQRKVIARKLTELRDLRNRMAHHEPVIKLDLDRLYHTILQLTEWLDADAATWAATHSTWGMAYAGVPALIPQGQGAARVNPAIIAALPI